MNLQDALTIIKFRLAEQEKLRKPLAELVEAISTAILAEDLIKNAPGLKAEIEQKTADILANALIERNRALMEMEEAKQTSAEFMRRAAEEKAQMESVNRMNAETEKQRHDVVMAERVQQKAALYDQIAILISQKHGLEEEVAGLESRRSDIKRQLESMLKGGN